MQSVIVDAERAGSLLFVRSLAELPGAVRAVNALLSRRGSSGTPGHEVLGILVREELDAGVPKPSCELHHGVTASLTVCEYASLSGIWSLCWFASAVPDDRADAKWRRRRLLDLVLLGGPGSNADRAAGRLVPVLTRAEATADVAERVELLRARYPMVTIGPTCFVHDAERGELLRLASMPLPRGLGRTP